MPFEIFLQKPAAREREDNRLWVRELGDRFSELRVEQADHAQLAQEVAADVGLRPDEYLARGIGVGLEQHGEVWMQIHFWLDSASISLANFPEGGPERALAEAVPIITFLLSLGFALIDPETGDATGADPIAILVPAYQRRQEQVLTVARITGGTPG